MKGESSMRSSEDFKKPLLRYPVIVEGKYDKIKLSSLFSGEIFEIGGFGIFKNQEKAALFRRMAEKTPLIIAVDPDGGGKVIRSYFSSILPPDRLYHVYIPRRKGKEPRKTAPSKAGFLGLEGMDSVTLAKAFAPYLLAPGQSPDFMPCPRPLSTGFLYAHGLTGVPGAAERREALCKAAKLPEDLSTPALRRALPLLFSEDELETLLASLSAP